MYRRCAHFVIKKARWLYESVLIEWTRRSLRTAVECLNAFYNKIIVSMRLRWLHLNCLITAISIRNLYHVCNHKNYAYIVLKNVHFLRSVSCQVSATKYIFISYSSYFQTAVNNNYVHSRVIPEKVDWRIPFLGVITFYQ